MSEQVARESALRLLRKHRRVPQANFHRHVIDAAKPAEVTKQQAVDAVCALVREGIVDTEGHYFVLNA